MEPRKPIVPVTNVWVSNLWECMVYASCTDVNGAMTHTAIMARLTLKRMQELVTPFGVVCGADAFRTTASIFGKTSTAEAKRLIYGSSMVHCEEHGTVSGDFGHMLPASMGGVMRMEHLSANGVWFELHQLMPHCNSSNTRIVNTFLECNECNRRKGAYVSIDAQLYLSRIPITINGETFERFQLS